MDSILWKPSPESMARSYLADFIRYINQRYQVALADYSALHAWSVDHLAQFWHAVWDFCGVMAAEPPTEIMLPGKCFQDTQWFIGAKLNFAENLLRRRDEQIAIVFASERGDYRMTTYADLYTEVARLGTYLRQLGVGVGDRVVAMMPNMTETVVAMLATTSVGAIWSSCSPDFGLEGLVDRFEQVKPKILFAVEGHAYKGKNFNHLEKIVDLQKKLPTLEKTIVVPYIQKPDISNLKNTVIYSDCLVKEYDNFYFEQLPFNHPVYILYSSGTTGKPKCLVHGAGGTLLQHLKELMLHTDLHPKDRLFFYTTCGWMMWNWMVSTLATGASIVLYDGAPFHPTENSLFDLVDKADVTALGVGAKFLESAEKLGLSPKKSHALRELRMILTTGSPLLPESFDYVYREIQSDLRLSSISGGSDIISCFASGNPLLPVYRGELQCLDLGMDVKIFNDEGQSVINEKGELVCTKPFPCMPLYFLNDENGEKYQKAYFEKYPGVWAHGDLAEITDRGTLIVYGRSDTTLNIRGIRMGTAEIYQQVQKVDEVLDSIVVSQNWQGDARMILFVILRDGVTLTDALKQKIKTTIKQNTSPYHVPDKIIAVPDLPRTKNNKLVELAVKNTINNEPIKNLNSLENPDVLNYFKNLKELQD